MTKQIQIDELKVALDLSHKRERSLLEQRDVAVAGRDKAEQELAYHKREVRDQAEIITSLRSRLNQCEIDKAIVKSQAIVLSALVDRHHNTAITKILDSNAHALIEEARDKSSRFR